MFENEIIKKARKLFYETIKRDDDLWNLLIHVPEAEKWANKLFNKFSSIEKEIVILSVWLHDISHYPVVEGKDHAVVSESMAKEFLEKEKYDPFRMEKVMHCIRSHRNRDVPPKTPEAKFMCMIDSISHFTYAPYIEMVRDSRGGQALDKLERDYRDLDSFPEIKGEMANVYQGWKMLIEGLLNSSYNK